jgi:hypothetical protein
LFPSVPELNFCAQYASLFAMHSISIDVLHLLTESYLIDMGIADADDRRRLLDGIKHLNKQLSASSTHHVISEGLSWS